MDQFREALRAFLKESCEFLASQPSELREWIRIVREDGGRTSFPVELRPDFSQGLLQFLLLFDKTQSAAFDRLIDIVRQDARLSSVLLVDAGDKPIEEEKTQRWWLKNMLAGRFVNAYVNRTKGFQFAEKAFGELFDDVRREIESLDITVTELSPLINVEIESAQIQIQPGIRLRQISTSELEEWLNTNSLDPSQPLASHQLVRLQCSLEVVYQQNRLAAPGFSEKGSRLITAMRLITDGFPRAAFTRTSPSSFVTPGYSMTSWGPLTIRFGPSVRITKSQEPELIKLYDCLGSSPNLSVARLALLRWNSAGDRLTEEDKLIDYWIALESLFVPDATQELSYRAALRIAAFLGSNGPERRRIYEEMKDSYRLRSEIVHGSIRKKRKKLTVSELTGLTRSYLSRSLLKILDSNQRFDAKKLEILLLAKE